MPDRPESSAEQSGVAQAYDAFAEVYDRFIAAEFAKRLWPAIVELFVSRLTAGAQVLDLCCGTGKFAGKLVEAGFAVTGLDISPDSISVAEQNVPGATFRVADARDFSLVRPVDAVLSAFNSLAHIETRSDMQSVFQNVRASLAETGLFVFDLNTERSYMERWRGSFSIVGDEQVCVVRPSYDEKTRTGRNDVTLFWTVAGENWWARHDFVILQRCHPEEELRALLKEAGFRRVTTYDARRDLGIRGEAGRLFFVCSCAPH